VPSLGSRSKSEIDGNYFHHSTYQIDPNYGPPRSMTISLISILLHHTITPTIANDCFPRMVPAGSSTNQLGSCGGGGGGASSSGPPGPSNPVCGDGSGAWRWGQFVKHVGLVQYGPTGGGRPRINTATGNLFEEVTRCAAAPHSQIALVRYYNSQIRPRASSAQAGTAPGRAT